MIGRRLAQIASLEKRIAELSERVHTLEQHRRVELNRQNTGDLRIGQHTATPPGFLRAGWSEGTDAKPYRFGGAFPEDIADHAPANPNPYGASEDLR